LNSCLILVHQVRIKRERLGLKVALVNDWSAELIPAAIVSLISSIFLATPPPIVCLFLSLYWPSWIFEKDRSLHGRGETKRMDFCRLNHSCIAPDGDSCNMDEISRPIFSKIESCDGANLLSANTTHICFYFSPPSLPCTITQSFDLRVGTRWTDD
jgi:hypothetical protein